MEICDYFVKIDKLLEDFKVYSSETILLEIKNNFYDVNNLIDNIEDSSNDLKSIKYSFHSKQAVFFGLLVKENDALKQEKKANEFEQFNSNIINDFSEWVVKDSVPSNCNDFENKFKSILKDLDPELINKSVLEEKFEIFVKILPDNYANYTALKNEFQTLNVIIQELSLSMYKMKKSSQEKHLQELKSIISNLFYSLRTQFIENVLICMNAQEILFGDLSLTEELINKRFRELALCFHSDHLKEKDKCNGDTALSLTNSLKEKLIKEIENKSKKIGEIAFYEERANSNWKKSLDFRYLIDKVWNKLTILNKNDYENLTCDEIENLRKNSLKLAYEDYRASCKIADKLNKLDKQVELRQHMALCRYALRDYVSA